MCNFSRFSRRIPSLEHPRVECTLPPELRKLYRMINLNMILRGKRCSLSSSYFTHIDRLTSARNCVLLRAHNWIVDSMSVLQSLKVSCRHQMIRASSFQGAQRYEYYPEACTRWGSGLTSPLGSVLIPCTVRYRPASLV